MTEIDVSGCNLHCCDGDCALYYADLSSDNNELLYGFNCEDNPNCYYKQLKRLETENTKLKDTFKEIKTICKEYSENCKIDGNCIDDRLCSTCYFGGAIELIDELNEVLKDD